jgi:hypothetical protein
MLAIFRGFGPDPTDVEAGDVPMEGYSSGWHPGAH